MARAAREKTSPEPDPVPAGPDLHMHQGKCTICRHPRRKEIERAFVDWTSPREIARTFGLRSHATVYRHAHARHLFEHRRRNLHMALGRIVERVGEIEPTAGNVIAAIALMAKINARGEWSAGRFSLHEARDRAYWEGVSAEQCESALSTALADEETAEAANEQEEAPEAEFEDEAGTDEISGEQSEDVRTDNRSGRPSPEPAAVVGMCGSQSTAPTLATVAGRGDVPSPAPPPPETQHREPEPPAQSTAPDPATSTPPIALSGPPLVAGIPWPWSPKNPLTFSRRRRGPPPR